MVSTKIGIAITVGDGCDSRDRILSAHRRASFPPHGWLGIVALVAAELLMFRGVEPVATYFTPIAWSAWILIADAAVLAITGRSRLNDAPLTLRAWRCSRFRSG